MGCSRNDVDSEELAGRLVADGWSLTEGDQDTDVVLVNTCGFIEQAKKDSIDALLEVAQDPLENTGIIDVESINDAIELDAFGLEDFGVWPETYRGAARRLVG